MNSILVEKMSDTNFKCMNMYLYIQQLEDQVHVEK